MRAVAPTAAGPSVAVDLDDAAPAPAAAVPVAHARAVLAGIVAVGFVARMVAALAHPAPQYFQDEYLYSALARALAHGSVTVRGGVVAFPALVEPLLAAPAWLVADPALAYRLVQGMHALLLSLAAVPVFLLARRVGAGSRDALLAAAATVALPSFAFGAYLTADAAGVTFALFAVLAAVAAIEQPTVRRQLLFLALAVLATLTRVQYAFLPVAFVLAALVVEGGVRGLLRRYAVALGALAAAAGLVAVAAIGGIYRGLGAFHLHPAGIAHWIAADTFLLAVATGAVVLPGAVAGIATSLPRGAGRPERGFAVLAAFSLAVLLGQAALFSVNLEPRFIERYLMLAGPLLLVALCLAGRRPHAVSWVTAVGVALVVALMRIPVSGYAVGPGRRDSPLLWAVHQAEGTLGIGAAGLVVSATAALLVIVAILAFRLTTIAVSACLVIALVTGTVTSLAATRASVARAADARATFAPDDLRWVDHAGLGPTAVLVTPGSDAPVVSSHLFWNTSLDRVTLLDAAARTDSFRTGHARIAPDGTVLSNGVPLRGPVLVEEYASAAQLRDAELLVRTDGTSLWRGHGPVRLATLTDGRFLDGWLSYRSRIRTWPLRTAGRSSVVVDLSLPANAPAQRVVVAQAGGTSRTILVRPGITMHVSIPVGGAAGSEIQIACPRALQVSGGRLTCVQASVPRLVEGSRSGSRSMAALPIRLT